MTCLQLCNAFYKENTIEKWTIGCIISFPMKGIFTVTRNYRGITPTDIANRFIRPWFSLLSNSNSRKILDKIKTVFEGITPQTHKFGLSVESSESGQIFPGKATVCMFYSKAFDFINSEKMEQISVAYGLSKETVTAKMILYKTKKAVVFSSNGDTNSSTELVGLARKYIKTIFVYNLQEYVLCTLIDLLKMIWN